VHRVQIPTLYNPNSASRLRTGLHRTKWTLQKIRTGPFSARIMGFVTAIAG